MLQREPFLSEADRKATVLWRPREWRTWWDSEPLTTKIMCAVCFALSLWGAYDVFRGNAEVGWALLAITGLLLGILLLVQIVVLVRASLVGRSAALATVPTIRNGCVSAQNRPS